jgi:hypothetical protein
MKQIEILTYFVSVPRAPLPYLTLPSDYWQIPSFPFTAPLNGWRFYIIALSRLITPWLMNLHSEYSYSNKIWFPVTDLLTYTYLVELVHKVCPVSLID